MNLSRDLGKTGIYLKGFLFLVILLLSAILLLFDGSIAMRLALIWMLSWSSARLYYFMFYVIEKYVDPTYRFSGIFSFIQYLLKRSKSTTAEIGTHQTD